MSERERERERVRERERERKTEIEKIERVNDEPNPDLKINQSGNFQVEEVFFFSLSLSLFASPFATFAANLNLFFCFYLLMGNLKWL